MVASVAEQGVLKDTQTSAKEILAYGWFEAMSAACFGAWLHRCLGPKDPRPRGLGPKATRHQGSACVYEKTHLGA